MKNEENIMRQLEWVEIAQIGRIVAESNGELLLNTMNGWVTFKDNSYGTSNYPPRFIIGYKYK